VLGECLFEWFVSGYEGAVDAVVDSGVVDVAGEILSPTIGPCSDT